MPVWEGPRLSGIVTPARHSTLHTTLMEFPFLAQPGKVRRARAPSLLLVTQLVARCAELEPENGMIRIQVSIPGPLLSRAAVLVKPRLAPPLLAKPRVHDEGSFERDMEARARVTFGAKSWHLPTF